MAPEKRDPSKSNLSAVRENSVMVIGNFDGVHKGHRALLKAARLISGDTEKPISVMTFEPHPAKFFNPDIKPFRLTPLDIKTRILDDLGVEYLMLSTFDENLSEMTADVFMRKMLVNANPSHIVVGENFYFGKGKEGTAQMLQDHSDELPFDVSIFKSLSDDNNDVYSSTRIREYIQAGDIQKANNLLGWKWEIEGTVIEGDKRGRQLGFPTANMTLGEYIRPAFGVYAVRVAISSDDVTPAKWYPAVANIGIRPMYPSNEPLVEAYIFDFSADLYGKEMRVQLVKHLRDEAKLDTEQELIKQIRQDCENARSALEQTK